MTFRIQLLPMPCINVSQWGIEVKKVMLIPDYLIPTVGKKEKKKEKKNSHLMSLT